jgi:hypothetical protein
MPQRELVLRRIDLLPVHDHGHAQTHFIPIGTTFMVLAVPVTVVPPGHGPDLPYHPLHRGTFDRYWPTVFGEVMWSNAHCIIIL